MRRITPPTMIAELIATLALLSATLTRLSTVLAATAPHEPMIASEPLSSEMFVAEVTAYTSSPEETDDTPFITASGTSTRSGIAACPRRYPFGAMVEIKGKEYNCQDRTHPRFDQRFDIWMENKQEAIIFGLRKLEVTVKYIPQRK